MSEDHFPNTTKKVPPRKLRWLCQSCGWNGDDDELLRAPNPFFLEDTIVGCPNCKVVENMANACDEPGCDKEATSGFPDPGGYRRTCGLHFQWFSGPIGGSGATKGE